MHCVVNELGKGMLHTANTMGILRCFQFSQCGTGNSGEVGGISDWAGRAPSTPCAVPEGGQSSVGWHAGDTRVCLHHPTPQLSAWDRHCSQSRAGLCKQILQVIWTACVRKRTARCSHSQLQPYLAWHWQLSKSHSPLWRAVQAGGAELSWDAMQNANSWRCHWYLLDSSYQLQGHNYILQHKIHYCSWINCSSGCRMPLCTAQPSLCLQFQAQSRCFC